MPSISVPTAILGAAAIGGVGSVASGFLGASGAESAAGTQAAADEQAQQIQLAEFQATQKNLQPFVNAGVTALPELQRLTGTNPGGNPLTAPLTKPFQPTMAQLQNTPGYQFTLGQGELATQNSFAAQGLGSSGAALKGGVNYAEGLASTTYQQQFQNYLQQNQQIANLVGGVVGSGQNAAAGLGSLAVQSGANQGAAAIAGGTALAGGTVGATNAITGAIGGLGQNAQQFALLNALTGGGLYSGSLPSPLPGQFGATDQNGLLL